MLTLPNILTLSRIFAVPILVFLLWPGHHGPSRVDYGLAWGLYTLMAVTDYFDGYLAARRGRSPSSASSWIRSQTRS